MIWVGEQLPDGLTKDIRSLRWSVMVNGPATPPKMKKISLSQTFVQLIEELLSTRARHTTKATDKS